MRKQVIVTSGVLLLLVLASCGFPGLAPSSTATPFPTRLPTSIAPIPNFDHIFVIVMENKEESDVIGNSAAPYINSLAYQYGLAANYYAVSHPSLPNYLELLGGSTFGITSDCTDCFINAPNLIDQLERARKSWKAYMEDMPGPCYVGSTQTYAMKHDPFLYFDDIRSNQARCAHVVPLSGFARDLATDSLPDFVWITPNLCHDTHDCGVSAGDAWLQQMVPQILQARYQHPRIALFLVWDEGSSNAGCCQLVSGGHVPLVVVSPLGKRGFTSHVAYDHASLLLTIEAAWNLGTLGDANCACTNPLSDFFA